MVTPKRLSGIRAESVTCGVGAGVREDRRAAVAICGAQSAGARDVPSQEVKLDPGEWDAEARVDPNNSDD